jgi:hypothetical protein
MRNRDWIVDDYGIRATMREGTFDIPAARLGEMTMLPVGEYLYWPIHIASETRFDIEFFLEAYQDALIRHQRRYDAPVHPILLQNSIKLARDIWGDRPVCG